MSPYDQLLEATISHLHELKAKGSRYLNVEAESLVELSRPLKVTPPAPPVSDRVRPPLTIATVEPSLVGDRPPLTAVEESDTASGKKRVAMEELRSRAGVCQKCPNLARSRRNVVFGVGDLEAPLMFVGEAPGADEDEQGEPFVGAAGQLLTRMINTMGFSRQTVYIANIVKCRPDTPGQLSGNRKPTTDEMNTCLPYLLAQIDLIQPRVIVALGTTAVEGLLGKSIGISRLRGQFRDFRGIPVMPTYHPAYLLRNQGLGEKRKVWEDMLEVLKKLGSEISEKQRGYFLKP